jgi:hypothetical protein
MAGAMEAYTIGPIPGDQLKQIGRAGHFRYK